MCLPIEECKIVAEYEEEKKTSGVDDSIAL